MSRPLGSSDADGLGLDLDNGFSTKRISLPEPDQALENGGPLDPTVGCAGSIQAAQGLTYADIETFLATLRKTANFCGPKPVQS